MYYVKKPNIKNLQYPSILLGNLCYVGGLRLRIHPQNHFCDRSVKISGIGLRYVLRKSSE